MEMKTYIYIYLYIKTVLKELKSIACYKIFMVQSQKIHQWILLLDICITKVEPIRQAVDGSLQ